MGTKDALFNIQTGLCAKPGENNMLIDRAVEAHRCYHENWWKKFDTRGGKFCRRNYFLAGLFRSHCNSLYCIEMAKCCSVKRSIWTDCKQGTFLRPIAQGERCRCRLPPGVRGWFLPQRPAHAVGYYPHSPVHTHLVGPDCQLQDSLRLSDV